MARPQKNSVDYFPFYCEEGKKIYYIEEVYGNDGFATVVKLLRALAKTEFHYLDLSEKSTALFLSAKCKVSLDKLFLIINDLVELGKFNSQLWKENKIIWCEDFIQSIQDAYKKRGNDCMSLESLDARLISLGIRKQGLSIRKPQQTGDNSSVKPQRKEKEIKEKESKEKESKENIPSESEFLNYCKEIIPQQFDQLQFSLSAKLEQWKINNWLDGNGKEIKNWKTKIKNTIPYLKPLQNGKTAIDRTTRDKHDSDARAERLAAEIQGEILNAEQS